MPPAAKQLAADALAQARAGRLAEAEATLGRLLQLEPRNARAWAMQGSLRLDLDRATDALAAFDRALALDPRAAAVHVNRGAALGRLGRLEEALAGLDAALALDPSLALAHANRASLLNRLERWEEAVAAARRATSLQPALAAAWTHLGAGLYDLGRLDEALAAFETALARSAPQERAKRLCDLGMALAAQQRFEPALAAFDEAAALRPDDALPRYRRAHARLVRRDFAGGWDDYEWRWRAALFTDHASGRITPELRRRLTIAPTPEALTGRVLAIAEQGIGDEIMFASILPDLASQAKVTAVVDPRLVRLMSHSMPQVEILPGPSLAGLDFDAFDHVVALGSLAHAFRRSGDAFPGTPFLAPRAEVVAAWADRLGPRRAPLRIGLSWRGGVRRTLASERSMPLAALTPLLVRPDCEFVSLQYGEAADEIAALNAGLERPLAAFPGADTHDFEDLAGLVANLDLVVTVQTALAHLTGALGKRGFVMIPERAEWRYTAAGEDIPWYGSLRLFRRGAGEAWGPVVDRIAAALAP
ncbi:tetratricopeptide repeat protein [Phenylobacterium sp. J367]|uniref:tetratricopeptide repeat protein n=1 Tax=Phenylobacterium sp. J367 TaxID=2898435 RepID=UPI0021511C17|nr:tetratricopeptide repeat protein [Phenylobacterium sp. J367]MCR5877626.1 tetratricopeptide repeat protein [Phenylobacterium sp. J367]